MSTNSTLLKLVKPTVSGDSDVWGGYLNTTIDSLDTLSGPITTGGSANAYTLTTGQTLTAYADKQSFWIKASFANTGAATLNIDAIGAKNLRKLVQGTLTALSSGDINSGDYLRVVYNSASDVIVIISSTNPTVSLDPTLQALAALSWPSGSPVVQFTAADTISLTLTPSLTDLTLSGKLKAAAGTSSAPGITFSATTGHGLFDAGAGTLGISANGTQVAALTPSSMVMWTGVNFLAQDGTVGGPGISFANSSSSGFYRIGANNIGIALNGTKYGDLATTLFDFTVPTRAKMPVSSETSGTLTTASQRKKVNATGGITLDGNVYAADDFMLIYAGASARTLTQGTTGSPTQRLHGSATTGNLTLAAYGFAIVHWVSATEWSVMGDVS